MRFRNSVRRVFFVMALLTAGALGYRTLTSPQGIPALREKWNQIREMEEQNATLQRENDYRRDRIKKLQSNAAEQELEIRKKLKLLRPGETSFILPDASHASPPDGAPPRDGSAAPTQPPAQ